ncbi:hypothetical protein ARMSODRAFT_1004783 [Armillaria solidipes]|uniref:Uncharacterized protein n=1 Tax=Armillaria solidipes TaxID=1076256 RepID=A0A2H3BQV5_9AGAR|nr:hypothetical protein ARMSODRAFT_1004783 [Armillaria solidipes]
MKRRNLSFFATASPMISSQYGAGMATDHFPESKDATAARRYLDGTVMDIVPSVCPQDDRRVKIFFPHAQCAQTAYHCPTSKARLETESVHGVLTTILIFDATLARVTVKFAILEEFFWLI